MDSDKDFTCAESMWYTPEKQKYNFTVNMEGDKHGFTEGVAFVSSSASFSAAEKDLSASSDGDRRTVTAFCRDSGLSVTQHYRIIGQTIRQYNTVENTGEKTLPLIHISSALFDIDSSGVLNWNDPRRFRIHWCKSGWCSEGQWKSGGFEDFGMAPVRFVNKSLQTPCTAQFRSEGFWSSGRYYPLVIIEDLEKNVSYFMEHEGGVSWEINIGKLRDFISVECNSANINHDGWRRELLPGERFETTSALYGRVTGGFEAAVAELIRAKRVLSQVKTQPAPLCYNCFMGGVFGEPTGDNLLSLIKSAAEAGCEVFCIDAGWYRPEKDTAMYDRCGDYVPDPIRFGKGGLESIISAVKVHGMQMGLWFEFEAVNCNMQGARLHKNTMIKRAGRVVSPERGFYDICDDQVRHHLLCAVERVYEMGVRYIKNDFNFAGGVGLGDSARGEREYYAAFCSFVDELYRRFPDIVIENCGSGAMRADNATLSHFALQSTSDQEKYFNYPTIAAGSAALMPPEKAGNWCYPFAVTPDEFKAGDEKSVIGRADTEETIFNMVTGCMGAMLMSGRIDLVDAGNFALIREGVSLYKSLRGFIGQSYPVYPTGFGAMGRRGFVTMGLVNEKKSEMLLAVWKIKSADDIAVIDLGDRLCGGSFAELIYPAGGSCEFSYAGGRLTVKLSGRENMARLFRISVR